MQVKIAQRLHFESGTITFVPGSIRAADVFSSSSSSSSSASSAPTGRSRSSRTKKGVSSVNGISSSLTIDALKMHMLAIDIGTNIEHVNHIVLHYNGVALDNGGKSLLDYRIPNGAKIEFAIDTSQVCDEFLDSASRAPERGFADSNFFKS